MSKVNFPATVLKSGAQARITRQHNAAELVRRGIDDVRTSGEAMVHKNSKRPDNWPRQQFKLTTVTYQGTDPQVSAKLGELSGRASRVETFEGHALSHIRSARGSNQQLEWASR